MNLWQQFLAFVDSALEIALVIMGMYLGWWLLILVVKLLYKGYVFLKDKHDAWFHKKAKEMAAARLASMSEEEKEALKHQIILKEWKETQFKPALRRRKKELKEKKKELEEKIQVIEKIEKY